MSLEKVAQIFAILVALCSMGSAMIREHQDGSISSNSGPVNLLQRLFLFGQQQQRSKRASIGSMPSMVNSYNNNNGNGMSYDQINLMINEHNKYRRLVQSTNMQEIKWDSQLARSAQDHANKCVFEHTSASVRSFGENLWASPANNPGTAVRLWFDEVRDGQCNCFNTYKACCGHYTQIVWAETNKVGCGLAYCGNVANAPGQQYLMVCHYNPAGNVLQMAADGSVSAVAAFNYRPNSACTECPQGSSCNNGLCDVK